MKDELFCLFLLSTYLMERVLLLLGAGLSDTYKAHTSIPKENLYQGFWSKGSVCGGGGGLVINLLYRGGSSNYLLRGSVNNIIMATGTPTVILVNFQGKRGWWSWV